MPCANEYFSRLILCSTMFPHPSPPPSSLATRAPGTSGCCPSSPTTPTARCGCAPTAASSWRPSRPSTSRCVGFLGEGAVRRGPRGRGSPSGGEGVLRRVLVVVQCHLQLDRVTIAAVFTCARPSTFPQSTGVRLSDCRGRAGLPAGERARVCADAAQVRLEIGLRLLLLRGSVCGGGVQGSGLLTSSSQCPINPRLAPHPPTPPRNPPSLYAAVSVGLETSTIIKTLNTLSKVAVSAETVRGGTLVQAFGCRPMQTCIPLPSSATNSYHALPRRTNPRPSNLPSPRPSVPLHPPRDPELRQGQDGAQEEQVLGGELTQGGGLSLLFSSALLIFLDEPLSKPPPKFNHLQPT
jgi:hypothetical protein